MVVKDVEPVLKGGNYLWIQRIIFPTGCKMLIFGHCITEILAVAALQHPAIRIINGDITLEAC